jgi:hypothetical protein
MFGACGDSVLVGFMCGWVVAGTFEDWESAMLLFFCFNMKQHVLFMRFSGMGWEELCPHHLLCLSTYEREICQYLAVS